MEHDNGKTFLVIYNTLAQFGYAVKYKILDAQEYGNVPQKRKRIFIVAFLDYDISLATASITGIHTEFPNCLYAFAFETGIINSSGKPCNLAHSRGVSILSN